MNDKQTQSIVAKLIGAGAAFAAALVVQKVLGLAWQAKTGHHPPKADDQGGGERCARADELGDEGLGLLVGHGSLRVW